MPGLDMERFTVEGVGRVYTDYDDWLPSCTTVLSMRPKPAALKRWQENTDDYEQIMEYKQCRGTLMHYEALHEFMPEVDGEQLELWSQEEQDSEDTIKEGVHSWERYEEEREWMRKKWNVIKAVTNMDYVIDVETFVTEHDVGFAGQFDLLYQDQETNETVLADLKTSKGVYEKHQLQLAAYSKAVGIAIDRLEVIRFNPDHKDWYISSSEDWERDIDDLWSEFIGYRTELEEKRMDTMLDHIQTKIDTGEITSASQAG